MPNDLLQRLTQAIDRRESVALVTVTDGDGLYATSIGRHCLIWLDPARPPVGDLALGTAETTVLAQARGALQMRRPQHFTHQDDQGSATLFADVLAQPPHLIVVGAGHIAVPLAQIAKVCEFEVTVLDDRPQYAHPARFPTADRVIAGAFRPELRMLRAAGKLDAHTYVVLVTRGHQHDVDSLLEILDDPLAYVGMIGSRRRVRAVFDLLEAEQGIAPERLDRVAAPIGIDIGARTPAEIAVCIMAELINVLRGGPAIPLSEPVRAARQSRRAAGTR